MDRQTYTLKVLVLGLHDVVYQMQMYLRGFEIDEDAI